MAISTKLTGYVCPECLLQFDTADEFSSHYWYYHSHINLRLQSAIDV